MPVSAIRQFLRWEAAGGITLIGAAAIAIISANSPFASWRLRPLGVLAVTAL